ncbi:MAG: hypothetical protein RLZZ01_1686 [Actinomycetota bacterium]
MPDRRARPPASVAPLTAVANLSVAGHIATSAFRARESVRGSTPEPTVIKREAPSETRDGGLMVAEPALIDWRV